MKRPLFLASTLWLAATVPLPADSFFPITGVSSATAATDLFPASRLIEGPGVGFQATEPHNRTSSLTWVTNAPNGGAGDYFEPLPFPAPVLVFDLGTDRDLSEISVWGYSDGNGNGAREFSLRFATAADGPNGFNVSIGYNPTFTITKPATPRQSLSFTQVVRARYVELTPTDNFFGIEPPGGDRVGLGEVAFEDRPIPVTATLDAPSAVNLFANSGGPEELAIPIGNTGQTALTITSATFSGPHAAAFSLVSLPGTISMLGNGTLTISVNPAGQPARMEATLTLVSNDPASPKTIAVTARKPSEFYPITSVVGTTQATDFFPEWNLIQGIGVGFDSLAPHNQLPGAGGSMLWVTNDPNGGAGDYFSPLPDPAPVFVFDLGEDRLLSEISLWGYSTGNANGMKDFKLRFATAAEGPAGMGTSITFAPQLVQPFGFTERHSLSFGRLVRARYVELTPLDNYFGTGAGPGGDRVGIGEVAFEVTPSVDPQLSAPPSLAITSSGATATGTIEIANLGATRTLTIADVSPGGAQASLLSVVSKPASLAPGATGTITYSLAPGPFSGPLDAFLTVTTNDPLNPTRIVRLTGTVRNPQLTIADTFTAGPLPPVDAPQTIRIPLGNGGESNPLNLSDISFSGPQAASFSVSTNPSPVGPKSQTELVLNFNRLAADGVFRTTLRAVTNDPERPQLVLPITVTVTITNPLVAWWPLDADGNDASGNGHHGIASGTPFPSEGATPATGGGHEFDGFSRFDVPYSKALNPDGFTVTLWAKPTFAGGGYASPITSRDDVSAGVQTHGYILYNDAAGLWSFWSGDGNPGWDVIDGPAVTTGQWSHLAIVYNAATNTKTLYVDGSPAAVSAATSLPRYSPNGTTEQEALHIGAGQDDGLNFYFTGQLDDVAVFRDALPESAIRSIMTNGVSSFLPPAPTTFRILSIAVASPGNVSLTFESSAGATYEIQRSPSPGSPWTTLPGTVTGLAGSTTFNDTSAPAQADKLFYRVRRVN
jgi:hypothetical protein